MRDELDFCARALTIGIHSVEDRLWLERRREELSRTLDAMQKPNMRITSGDGQRGRWTVVCGGFGGVAHLTDVVLENGNYRCPQCGYEVSKADLEREYRERMCS